MADPIRVAAEAFLQSYSEHLNSHCQACTAAWAKLRDALEAAITPAAPPLDPVVTRANIRMPSSTIPSPE